MDVIYKTFEKYNPNKEIKILIVFDDMTADMISSKTKNYLVFITQSYFAVHKNQAKFYTLFYYESSEQTRASAN